MNQRRTRMAATPPLVDADADAERLYAAVTRLVRAYQSRDRERICCHDITLSQWAALDHLMARSPMRLNELAVLMALDKSTTSRVVEALVGKRLLARPEDAEDRRAISLAVTPAGRALHQRIHAGLVQEEAALMAEMPAEHRQAAIALIDRLTTAAQRHAGLGEVCCVPPP